MEKKIGFSLAEALITLLIVSIIAVVSAPIITKKSRKIETKTVWSINTDNYATITPSDGRDIKLGRTRSGKTQGIVVVDRLEFKNRQGRVIGWINEDGSASFSGVSREMLHEELTNLITELSKEMQYLIGTSKQKNTNTRRENHSTKQHQIDTAKYRHPIKNLTNTKTENLNKEQIEEMEQLTQELYKILEMNNR